MEYDISDHAKIRWVHRIGQIEDPESMIESCWESGIVTAGSWSLGDETRYCCGHGVLIIRRGGVITTVLAPEHFDHIDTPMEFRNHVECMECGTIRTGGIECPDCSSTPIETALTEVDGDE